MSVVHTSMQWGDRVVLVDTDHKCFAHRATSLTLASDQLLHVIPLPRVELVISAHTFRKVTSLCRSTFNAEVGDTFFLGHLQLLGHATRRVSALSADHDQHVAALDL